MDQKTKIQLSEVYNNLKKNIPKQWRVEELSREALIKNGKFIFQKKLNLIGEFIVI